MTRPLSEPDADRLATLPEVARAIGRPVRDVLAAVAAGTLPPPIRVGGVEAWWRSELKTYGQS